METKKQPWEPMQLTYVGSVTEIVKHGGGKVSIVAGDTGEELRKPKGGAE